MISKENCPLCESASTTEFTTGHPRKRRYHHCLDCDLIFADPSSLLSPEGEKSRYMNHQNSERDEGYLRFLDRCLGPLKKYISKEQVGLDYGCGPYPMLVEIMREDGFDIKGYDPHFHLLDLTSNLFDYIISTEVVEHFYKPRQSWQEIVGKLKPSGYLGIMTGIRYSEIDFEKWYYRADETHVSFYSPKTIEKIADLFHLEIIESLENVIIFKKLSA